MYPKMAIIKNHEEKSEVSDGMVLWELLQPLAFKTPAHLGVAFYTINAYVRQAFTLSPDFWIQFLFPVCAEDYDLWVYP